MTLTSKIETMQKDLEAMAGVLEGVRSELMAHDKESLWVNYTISKMEGMLWAVDNARESVQRWESSYYSSLPDFSLRLQKEKVQASLSSTDPQTTGKAPSAKR